MSQSEAKPVATYLVGRWLLLRVFGVACMFAFLSLAHQIVALVGSAGLESAAESLAQHRSASGNWAFLRVPTIFWITVDDTVLESAMWLGVGLAALLTINVAPRLAMFGLWVLYLSVASLQPPVPKGVLFDFPPDHVLLEGGLFAIFLAPSGIRPGLGRGSPASLWPRLLLTVLLFKTMFGSGIAKVVNGQDIWWDFTAIYFDFETRPSPTPLAAGARDLPMWAIVGGAVFMFIAELLMPWLYFFPGRPRRIAAVSTLALMVVIMATGNYRWFPLMTFGIATLLIDDRTWWRMLRIVGIRPRDAIPPRPPVTWTTRFRTAVAAAATAFLITVGACQTLDSCFPASDPPRLLGSVRAWLKPYRVSHRFQLFGRVRKEHQSIVFEGSDDRQRWHEFDNRLSPGALDRRCEFVAPYHYYLDFLMWLSGDAEWHRKPGWLKNLMHGLLSGNEPIYDLFRRTHWSPEHPPKYVRGHLYVYRYADADSRARGQWWTRESRGAWSPTTTLRAGKLELVHIPAARAAGDPSRSR